MSLDRICRICRFLVPLLLAGGTVALWLASGELGPPLVVAALAGGLLGWAVMLALEGVLALAGLLRPSAPPAGRGLRQLERDKATVLRSIKEIEFDASIQQLNADEAAELSAPLRARAMRILHQLDQARMEQPLTVTQQIERELARRLERQGGS